MTVRDGSPHHARTFTLKITGKSSTLVRQATTKLVVKS